MVLIRIALLAALCLTASCKQSLFDNHGEGDASTPPGDDAGGDVPATCAAPCAADLAADFNGEARGVHDNWRYLEDHRDRTWLPMAPGAIMMGQSPGVMIAACNSNDAACKQLPNALLFSTSGPQGTSDPAAEITLPASKVVQLTVRARSSLTAQTLRLYRNSREDVLFTGAVSPTATLARTVTIDVVPGDRILVAVQAADGGDTTAVQLFATALPDVFPAACKVALSFSAADANTVTNACGPAFTHRLYDTDTETQPPLAAGPFPEQGNAGDFPLDHYFLGPAPLARVGDVTAQMWVKHRAFDASLDAWLFSDLDLNLTGGLGVGIGNVTPPQLFVQTCATATSGDNTFTATAAPWPDDHAWHFIRVVHTGGVLSVCLDGTKRTEVAVPPGFLKTSIQPYLGANAVWSPQGAYFDGELDDVRVLSTALPCE